MSVFVLLCFGAALLLGAIAAAYHPPAPPRYNLLAGAVAFLALGFLLQGLIPPG